jgi:hypothetical protein
MEGLTKRNSFSEATHRYLAGFSYAPKLRECCELRGQWVVVFMNISDYTPLYRMELSGEEKQKVLQKVR